jgi:hypothetical protein
VLAGVLGFEPVLVLALAALVGFVWKEPRAK